MVKTAFEMMQDRCLLGFGDLLHTLLPKTYQNDVQQWFSVFPRRSLRLRLFVFPLPLVLVHPSSDLDPQLAEFPTAT